MKKIIFALMLATGSILGATAQTCGTDLACANESGAVVVSATAPQNGSYTACLGNSLCGSRGMRVKVTVNGHQVYHNGSWNYGAGNPSFNANAGDVIEVTATPGPVSKDIVCVWAGEISVCIAGNF